MRHLTLVLLAAAAFSVGCKSDDSHQHDRGEEHAAMCSASLTKQEYGAETVVDQPGAKFGELTRCPISGAVFRVSEQSPHADQKGDRYYVCCGGCVDSLEQSFARRR